MKCFRRIYLIAFLLTPGIIAKAQDLKPPAKMVVCADNGVCQNLTWAGDHYDATLVDKTDLDARYQVRRWSADGIELHGNWTHGVGSALLEGTVTGKIGRSGNRVDNAIFDWKMGATGQTGKMVFTLAWGVDNSAPTAAIAQTSIDAITAAAIPVSAEVAKQLALSTPLGSCGRGLRAHTTLEGQLTISAAGKVIAVKTISAPGFCQFGGLLFHPELWQFTPYTVHGEPTPMLVTILIDINNGEASLHFK